MIPPSPLLLNFTNVTNTHLQYQTFVESINHLSPDRQCDIPYSRWESQFNFFPILLSPFFPSQSYVGESLDGLLYLNVKFHAPIQQVTNVYVYTVSPDSIAINKNREVILSSH